MSEKRYVIVSPSHHKKPRAMFLSAPTNGAEYVWEQGISWALLFTLSQARILAKANPIGMYFVEHTEAMQSVYGKTEQDKTYFDDFTGYAKHFGYEFICDWRQSENANLSDETQAKETSEPQENKRCYALYSKSADGSIKYFCDEKDAIVVALHKGQRVQIFTQSEAHELQHLPYTDEANADVWNVENIGLWNLGEPLETPEEKREYMLYRYLGDTGVKQFYYSYNEKDCYSKNLQSATLHTEDEAMLQVNKLAHAGSKGWFCVHCDAFNADGSFKEAEQETPTPAPEAKKRVGYVLYHSTERKEKLYAHYESNGVFVRVRVAGIVADAYRTPEDAQFAADVLNNNGDTNFNWQVEQIEF